MPSSDAETCSLSLATADDDNRSWTDASAIRSHLQQLDHRIRRINDASVIDGVIELSDTRSCQSLLLDTVQTDHPRRR